MVTATTIRMQFSKWYSKCKTEEEANKLRSILMEEAEEAQEDRMFELKQLPDEKEGIQSAMMDLQEYIGSGEYNGGMPPIYLSTATLAIEALKKQIPRKPSYSGDGYADGHLVYDTYECPYCGKQYETDYDNYTYCPECGQKLDMTMEVEDGE